MLNAPLPSQMDVRKLAVKGVEISATTPVSRLPRIVDLLADDGGSIEVALQFYIDEQRFRRIDGQLTGCLDVICQRCLQPMPVQVDTQFKLGIVWSEDNAASLPQSLEPLIVGEELVDLADIVSEELILSLPYVSYHDEADCQQQEHSFEDPAPASLEIENEQEQGGDAEAEAKENPFKVLEQLKFDK